MFEMLRSVSKREILFRPEGKLPLGLDQAILGAGLRKQ